MQEKDLKENNEKLRQHLKALGTSLPFSEMDERAFATRVMANASAKSKSNIKLWIGLGAALSAGLVFGLFLLPAQVPPSSQQHWLAVVYEAENAVAEDWQQSNTDEQEIEQGVLGWDLNEDNEAIAQWLFPDEEIDEIDLSEYL